MIRSLHALALMSPLAAIASASAQAEDLATRLQAALVRVQAELDVPAISAAFARDGELVWAGGVGVRSRRDGIDDNAVDEHTLFPATAISMSITAIAVMRLKATGGIDLDRPIAELPGAVALQRERRTGSAPVTLRHLLSHTAGTTVAGFPGYEPTEKLPSLDRVLAGGGNTERVKVVLEPGTRFVYSSGGFVAVQQILEAAREQPFEQLMRELVLEPVGMNSSTFAQPPPFELWRRTAHAHDRSGRPIGVRWFVYPEQAASGLWTTPSDLVRAMLAVAAAERGDANAVLSAGATGEMLAGQRPARGYGLGWRLDGLPRPFRNGHHTQSIGFAASAFFGSENGRATAYAVMVNSEQPGAVQRTARALLAAARPPEPEHRKRDARR